MMIQQIPVPGDLELGDLASRVDDNLAVVWLTIICCLNNYNKNSHVFTVK
jgi:hypothetical protein